MSSKAAERSGYKIGRTIGKGTYSEVRVAQDPTGNEIACKIIRKNVGDKNFLEKFLPREIEILSNLSHPNIISVRKILETQKKIYIFTDYCRDGDLLEYVKRRGRLSEPDARLYFSQIVAAVGHLHRLDVAHRDLKCENLFLSAGARHVMVGDFGFARLVSDDELSDTFCGSPAYAAPEVFQGLPYDPKMYDTWSLGCVLYIMVTGSMPFDERHSTGAIYRQLSRSASALSALCPDRSFRVENLIYSLLEPDPERRLEIGQVERHDWMRDDYEKAMKKFLLIENL